mgnify:FL=1
MILTQNAFGQVKKSQLSNDVTMLMIEHAKMTAKISLYGGQVLSWCPNGEKEVFWLSKESSYENGKAIRGGIPLCWPWFGSHPEDNNGELGNHGFVRGQVWHVDNIDICEQGVEVILSWQGEHMSRLWPHACQLKQVLFFGRSFKQCLKIKNLSNIDAYYTGALHSYFSVSSPKTINVIGLDKAHFADKLTGTTSKPEALKNGEGPIDRIYHTSGVTKVVDDYWNRTLELKATNTNQWVFWNPGTKVANKMVDIHHNGEQEFVCLEAANTEMQLLPSGKEVVIEQEIAISS